MLEREVIRELSPPEVREKIRAGEYAGPTSGLAPGHVQTNLVILPEEYAFDFLKFCVRNPKPCPVLEVTDAGSPTPAVMAPEADLRTDVPKYRVYERGELVDEPTDLHAYWQDDLVSFLIGCSFTFEAALLEAGLGIAHQDQGRNVPMYVTGHECTPSGPFSGPMVGRRFQSTNMLFYKRPVSIAVHLDFDGFTLKAHREHSTNARHDIGSDLYL